MMLRSGDVVRVGPAASVQFRTGNGFDFRVIKVSHRMHLAAEAWVDGYQLNSVGEAVERRSIFVRLAGLTRVPQRRQL